MLGPYSGQFKDIGPSELKNVLDFTTIVGQVSLATEQALRVVSNRTPKEIHRIAQRVEEVISAYAAKVAEKRRETDPHDPMFRRPSHSEQIDFLRVNSGDVNLWLNAGAEKAPVTLGSKALPSKVSRAEYLATIALWKVFYLRDCTAGALRALRSSSMYESEPSRAAAALETAEDVKRAFWNRPLIAAVGRMYEIAHFSADLTRAATLATEAEYLDGRIAVATGEVAKELKELAKQRHREASAEGGRKRAERYKKSKERIAELYREGGFTGARSAAAEAIFQKLRSAGEEVPFSRVLRTLDAEDKRVKAARSARAKAGKRVVVKQRK
jgi:hypothetical protein